MKKLALVACLYTGCVCGMDEFCSANRHFDAFNPKNNKSIVQQKSPVPKPQEITNVDALINITSTSEHDLAENSQGLNRSMLLNDTISLIDQISHTNNVSQESSEYGAFETSASAYREGRFWSTVRKIFQPVNIAANATTLISIPVAKFTENSNPSMSDVFTCIALGSAITSGVLSLFITKMNSRINTLNKIYKEKLEEEKIIVDTTNV